MDGAVASTGAAAAAAVISLHLPAVVDTYAYTHTHTYIYIHTLGFSALFFKDAAANFFRWLHFDSWFIYNVLPFGEFMPFLAPLTETQAATYMPSLYKPMGILGFNAICYLSNMDAALSLVQNTKVFSAVIR